jgi:putative transposase
MSISFKWKHFKQDVILMLVRWYLAYSLSYRDIEELALERGLKVDHSTINRWVIEYAPQLENIFKKNISALFPYLGEWMRLILKLKGAGWALLQKFDKVQKYFFWVDLNCKPRVID